VGDPRGRSSGLGRKPKATTGIRRKRRKSYLFLKFHQEMERARQRFAVAVKEARAIAQERGITDEEVLAEIRAVRAKQ
jgi:hypothetical protein